MSHTSNTDGAPPAPPGVYVDTAQTYRLTLISLAIGVLLALIVGGALFALRAPLTDPAQPVSLGSLIPPLAGVIVVAILAWAVFRLPVRLAKRQSVTLDPEVWPWTGAVGVGVVIVIGFILAILLRII
jgi:hypothetical protein